MKTVIFNLAGCPIVLEVGAVNSIVGLGFTVPVTANDIVELVALVYWLFPPQFAFSK